MRLFTAAWAASLVAVSSATAFEGVHFESPHVHPIDLSADGTRLFAVNTSDHRLSTFDVSGDGDPVLLSETFVGLEPVSVRARTADEVWVVSHLSDAVNIVDAATGQITRTLLPGDEPTDVAFAAGRAFVVVSQEDRVVVYDLADLDAAPATIDLDMSDPRSIALSPDGSRAYVAALDSQNETTIVSQEGVIAGGGLPTPTPPMDASLPDPPDVGLIVRYDGTNWRDETGGTWDAEIGYTLLDHDVIAIDTATLAVVDEFRGVGTANFNLAVHPLTGDIACTNQEARNDVRFEPKLQADFIRNRVTLIDVSTATVTPVHLNPHIDFADPAGNAAERAESIAFPLDAAYSADGTSLYVAGFGSKKVAVLDAGGLRQRTIPVGDGPSGLALDDARSRLYVLNRMDASITTVSLVDDATSHVPVGYDPSPAEIRDGRSMFYDAEFSSAHGEATCASCHVFGAMDNLSWNLGDPTGDLVDVGSFTFHPMKGPMATQALKGLPPTNPFHWRGDRAALEDFNSTFTTLLGRGTELATPEFDTFKAFVESMAYPPNPNQNLDGSLPNPPTGPNPTIGRDLYETGGLVADGSIECVDCHTFPTGETALIIPANLLQDSQALVVPHLRNMHEKTRFDRDALQTVRGFGFTKDGAIDTMVEFLRFPGFEFNNDTERAHVAEFMFAFNFEVAAALGATWTLDDANQAAGLPRIQTLMGVADAGDIGLIAKGPDGTGEVRGWTYLGGDQWLGDRSADPMSDLADLTALATAGSPITFTAVLFGSQERLGIDRDLDGFTDGDERDAGSDPANPASTPDSVGAPDGAPTPLPQLSVVPNPVRGSAVTVAFRIENDALATITVHDVQGRLVRTLLADGRLPETGGLRWDLADDSGRRVAAGIYFVRARAGETSVSQRLVLMR